MINSFDLISLIAILICLKTLLQIKQNWSKFWDDRVTEEDRKLAQQLALFILLPIAVLLHEIGHSVATWQVGGTVETFQWRFYWGYIIPEGNFTSLEFWWIALSGNLVSILLGLLPIPFIVKIRKRIVGEILYFFVCVELIHSLIIYPMMSFFLGFGDWIEIYDFNLQPYPSITLVLHLLLIWKLRELYYSRKTIQWRLSRDRKILNTWKQLKEKQKEQPENTELLFNLAYFLLEQKEFTEVQKIARQIKQRKSHHLRLKVLKLIIKYYQKPYFKAVEPCKKLLKLDLVLEDKSRLYRILCLSLINLRQISEALEYATEGLTIMPDDYKMRCNRALIYQALRKYPEANKDLDIALQHAPDEDTRKWISKLRRSI